MNFFSTVFAQIGNPVVTMGAGQTGIQFFGDFIPKMISIILIIGGLGFFFMFVLGAVRWITSGGDKAQVESARTQITQALTGLVIMLSAWAIARLIQSVFGINLLNFNLQPLIS